ncbi:MAG: hypothetical protein HN509_13375 [Halobacteriovoraceae bacterium]|jgi:hypothetical protein|nr:hypothetical protein [Halobacteriovoraceae bacterium]
MKLILFFLLFNFSVQNESFGSPLWKRKKNLSFRFLNGDTQLSTETGSRVFNDAQKLNWGPLNVLSLQNVGANAPLLLVKKCKPLIGLETRRCLLFNWNLNHASTFYLSWLFTYGASQQVIYHKAKLALTRKELSKKEIEYFLTSLPDFFQVEQLAQVHAIKHWEDFSRNWNWYSRELRNVGSLVSHDFALDFSARNIKFSNTARLNLASVSDLHSTWLKNKQDFLERIKSRLIELEGPVVDLRDFLKDPRYREVSTEILITLEKELND